MSRKLDSSKQREILEEIQANILKPHARKFATYLFLKFKDVDKKLIEWIEEVDVSTGLTQQEYSKKRKTALQHHGVYTDKEVLLNFCISSSGIKKVDKKFNGGFFEKTRSGLSKIFSSKDVNRELLTHREKYPMFSLGMKEKQILEYHSDEIGFEKWDAEFKTNIDALIVIAGSDKDLIRDKVDSIIKDKYKDNVFVWHCEEGEFRDDKKEPFGYKDGITKSRFFDGDILLEEQLDLVADDKFGSFVVFRKLKQFVREFNNEVVKLEETFKAETGNAPPVDYMKAQIMGRFPDGTPLLIERKSTPINPDITAFNDSYITPQGHVGIDYTMDLDGLKCPYHAHIRKVNPRSSELTKIQPPATIIRRGMPYGKKGSNNEGLLFMCFQQYIPFQFSLIQKRWCNDQPYNIPSSQGAIETTGLDPISGQTGNSTIIGEQKWVKEWNKNDKFNFSFKDFVQLKGGDFFYAPPKSFFCDPIKYIKDWLEPK